MLKDSIRAVLYRAKTYRNNNVISLLYGTFLSGNGLTNGFSVTCGKTFRNGTEYLSVRCGLLSV